MTGANMARSGAVRRGVRILRHALISVLLTAGALTASTAYHLDSDRGRRVVANAAEAAVSDLLVGDLTVGAIDELTLRRIVIRDVSLGEPNGEPVAHIQALTVEMDAAALFSGQVHIDRVEVSSPSVDLRPAAGDGNADGDGNGNDLALIAAVMLRDPSPSSDDSASALPTVHIDEIVVRDLAATGLPGALAVRSVNIAGRFDLEGTVSVAVSEMSAEVLREDEGLATLEALHGHFDMRPGARSEASFSVTAGSDRLSGDASLEWTESGPGVGSLELDVALSPALLDRLGIPGGSTLVSSGVRGTIVARGTVDDATVTADLETEGGPIRLSAERNSAGVAAEVAVDDLALGAIVPALGDDHASGTIRAHMGPNAGSDSTITVTGENVRYGEWVLPEVGMHARVTADRVEIEEVSVPHMAGDLEVTGHVAFNGDADLAVRARIPDVSADANVARLAPGVGGGLGADLTLRIAGGNTTTLDIEGRVNADAFRAPGLHLGHLDARGSIHGDARHPVVDLRVDARSMRAGDLRIGRASFDLRGGPERYAAAGTLTVDDDRRVDLEASVLVRDGRYLGDAELIVRGWWPEPVRVVLTRAIFAPDRFVSAERLSAESTGLSLEGSGRYGLVGASDLRATVHTIDLRSLGRALGRALPGGSAAGAVTFAGTPQNPELTVQGDARNLTMGPLDLPEISIAAALSSARREVSTTIHADAAGYGRIDVHGTGRLSEARGIEERLRGADYQIAVTLADVPATLLALASPDLPPFDGTMNITATAQGTPQDPQLEVVVDLDDFAAEGIAPMEADLRANYAGTEVVATLGIDDADGPLVTAQGTLSLDLPAIAQGAAFDINQADAVLDISVPTRRLDRLPAPFTVDIPARASLEASIRRQDGATSVRARGRMMRYARALADEGCASGPMVELAYEVDLTAGQTVVNLRGDAGGTQVGTVRADATTPVDDWIVDGFPSELPAVRATASIERLDLSRLPLVCARASGIATLRMEAQDLLTAAPQIDIEGAIEELSLGGSPAVELRFAGGVDETGASVDAVVQYEERSIVELVATAPVTFGEDGLTPAAAEGTARGELHLDRAPARVVLGAVPILAQVSGSLDGDVVVQVESRGPDGDPTEARDTDFSASGEITLNEIALIVTDPVVRVDGLKGAIAFSDEGIELREIRLRDRGGSLAVDGRLAMEGLTPRSLRAAVVADHWNLRADGVVFAIVNTELEIEADLGDDEREIRATFDRFSIEMPEEMGHTVQSLEQHPEVIYENQPGFYVDAGDRPAAEGSDSDDDSDEDEEDSIVPTRVIVDATTPFWIRRNDFSMQLTADLRINSDASGARITGPVKVKRGFINLLGRAFDLNQGEVIFGGGSRVDPSLDLTAVHALQSHETVTVTITGHLSDPRMNFSTTVPGLESEAEIIDLLVSGHGGSSMDARDQMVSVIGAMTAGFISSMTRRSVGTYIPVMSIEAGSGGSTRIRAGVSADAMIPDFLDGIVESAYVEGFVGSSEQQTDASGNTSDTGAQGGFVIELYWPRHIVTTGSYEQPANWSFDITWEP